ncbi:helix-turn-helix domain-containing protein [Leptospira sp. WS92.C1]
MKKEKNLNQHRVALKFGVTDSTITRLLNGKNPLTKRLLTQFESIFGISGEEWIVQGKGEMLLPADLDSQRDEDQRLLRDIGRRSGFRSLIEILLKLSDKNLAAIKALAEKLGPE